LRIYRKTILALILLISVTFFQYSCTKHEPQKIAISKGVGSEGYLQYTKWIQELNPEAKLVNLYGLGTKKALKLLKTCDGLILSGGPDVHPYYYNRMQDFPLCEIDSTRDTLEFALIEEALKEKMPILAVCRGMQILNVYFGGTLVPDIPKYKPENVGHRCEDKDKCFHDIHIGKSVNFPFLANVKNFKVNTNHHQAVDELVEDFNAWAFTDDGIIEGYEWRYPNQPFLIAVQWHPERLSDTNPEMSDSLGFHFLRAASEFKKNKKK
jgi:putative glutamine amidotransferase